MGASGRVQWPTSLRSAHMRVEMPRIAATLVLTLLGMSMGACDKECDERQFNDRKKVDDLCWDPPRHYCAQGGGQRLTDACDPVSGICCTYATTCIPCDFVDCSSCIGQTHPSPNCPAACAGAHSSDPEACKQPDPDQVICYED